MQNIHVPGGPSKPGQHLLAPQGQLKAHEIPGKQTLPEKHAQTRTSGVAPTEARAV